MDGWIIRKSLKMISIPYHPDDDIMKDMHPDWYEMYDFGHIYTPHLLPNVENRSNADWSTLSNHNTGSKPPTQSDKSY